MALYIDSISFSDITEKSTNGSWFDLIHSPILLNFFFITFVSIDLLFYKLQALRHKDTYIFFAKQVFTRKSSP